MKQCPDCQRAYEDSNGFCVFDGQRLVTLDDADPCIGMVIDNKYRVDRKIAKGGTGTVYQATHIQLNAPVAIKIIHPHMANDQRALERFRREALITMKVRHTNSIAVMDFGSTKLKVRPGDAGSSTLKELGITETQSVYVVMELLRGVTLDQRLRERGYLTPQETNSIMQSVCAALAVAHDHHIVHRDLKPENIFFHDDGDREIVKLVDFGIAKFRNRPEDNEDEDMKLTQAGFVVGTPFYMSPEQCGGFEVDSRSDIYALGVMIYQLLTGKLPFDGTKANIIVMKHITDKPKPIYEVRSDIPAVLNGVVMHALEKKPDDRPQHVLELAHELESAVKAVTEQELQKVFLNATEDDLEAALLLASEPGGNLGMLLEPGRMRSSGPLESDLTKQKSLEAIAISDTQQTQISITNDPAADKLFTELLYLTRDLLVLLQVVRGDLDGRSAPDPVSFAELRNSLDQLRGVLFGLSTTHYKNLL